MGEEAFLDSASAISFSGLEARVRHLYAFSVVVGAADFAQAQACARVTLDMLARPARDVRCLSCCLDNNYDG